MGILRTAVENASQQLVRRLENEFYKTALQLLQPEAARDKDDVLEGSATALELLQPAWADEIMRCYNYSTPAWCSKENSLLIRWTINGGATPTAGSVQRNLIGTQSV
jgi:hypothetical protein